MLRKIVLYGDPVLREKGAPVGDVTPEIRQLAADMLETMVDADGVGLAAQQIGEALQMAVVDVTHAEVPFTYFRVNGKDASLEDYMPLVILNPKVEGDGGKVRESEGCLSFPDVRADINRPEGIKATWMNLDGQELCVEADGLLARAIQHEVDHLNGILFIDRMSSAKKMGLKRTIRAIQLQGEEEARKAGRSK